MQIIAETDAEATLLFSRLSAISAALGPFVDLSAKLPNGNTLPKPLRGNATAQAATLKERMDDMIQRNCW